MEKTLVCIETGRKTKITLTNDEPWTNEETMDQAANVLLKRETEHRHDFVTIRSDKMRSEICHVAGDLTEHTGEYRTFKLV